MSSAATKKVQGPSTAAGGSRVYLPDHEVRAWKHPITLTGEAGDKGLGVQAKEVGPGPTLAWPGWKQPDIPVEVDTDRLVRGGSF